MKNFKRNLLAIFAGLGLIVAGTATAKALATWQAPSVDVFPVAPVAPGESFDIFGQVSGDAAFVTVTVTTGGNGNGQTKSSSSTRKVTTDPDNPTQPIHVKAKALGVGNGSLRISAVATDSAGNVVADTETVVVQVTPRRGSRR